MGFPLVLPSGVYCHIKGLIPFSGALRCILEEFQGHRSNPKGLLTTNRVFFPRIPVIICGIINICRWAIRDIENVLRREMRYKCFTCGIEFDSIEQLANHKRQHQAGSQSSSGVICLGCGKSIPLESSKANYSGPLTCPNCRRTMTVTIENSEVVTARLG
jgi:DNA-directed RNA polymerase subunit RPC12/RpoP